MKTRSLFICEICNEEYKYECTAKFCENSAKLKPCPLVVGQKVWVYNRYGYGDSGYGKRTREIHNNDPDWGSDTVVGFRQNSYILHNVENHRSEKEAADFLLTIDSSIHEWIVEMSHEHQMSKDDDSYTRNVGIENIQTTNHWMTSGVEHYEDGAQWLKDEYES